MTATMRELEADCRTCGHQNAIHTKGAEPGGWPIFDRVWANALGGCGQPDCDCVHRT